MRYDWTGMLVGVTDGGKDILNKLIPRGLRYKAFRLCPLGILDFGMEFGTGFPVVIFGFGDGAVPYILCNH